jgi:hypothetical protein
MLTSQTIQVLRYPRFKLFLAEATARNADIDAQRAGLDTARRHVG